MTNTAQTKNIFPKHLTVSAAIAAALLSSYGSREAFAGGCVVGSGATYTCSGPADNANDVSQDLNSNSGLLTVTTSPEFGIDTSVNPGRAFNLTSASNEYGISFTDNNAAAITSQGTGIFAKNEGFGGIEITTTGIITTTSNGSSGVIARNDSATTSNIIIAAQGDISSGKYGISTTNKGAGGTTNITTTGKITSQIRGGIFVKTETNAADVMVNVQGNISGYDGGVRVVNNGVGAVEITTTTTSTITAIHRPGINVNSRVGDIIITTGGSVSGLTGIDADGDDISNIVITTNGSVTGGISTETELGTSTITLNSGTAIVTGGISNNDAQSVVTVNTGASVLGDIRLADGGDKLSFNGGNFAGVTLFDGGAGDDALVFMNDMDSVSGVSQLVGGNVNNWETVEIGVGSIISFTDNALTTGELIHKGTLTTQDNATDDTLVVTGDYKAKGGTLLLDVKLDDGSPNTGDWLHVTENTIIGPSVADSTKISINNIGGLGGQTIGDGIKVVQVDGASQGVFYLDPPIQAGEYAYTLEKVGNNWYLQSSVGCALPGDVVAPSGEVNIQDVIAIINHVLAGTSAPCSDINGDGTTITDVIAAINIVLGN